MMALVVSWVAGGPHNYCVQNRPEKECSEYVLKDGEASGIDCVKGLSCDDRNDDNAPITSTCHRKTFFGTFESHSFAKKGSCNVNTGEPANILILLDKNNNMFPPSS